MEIKNPYPEDHDLHERWNQGREVYDHDEEDRESDRAWAEGYLAAAGFRTLPIEQPDPKGYDEGFREGLDAAHQLVRELLTAGDLERLIELSQKLRLDFLTAKFNSMDFD